MTFVSYAQNGEDVLLWRALRDVGAGFYVDVGAGHPETDSVTRALHDRGWRGVNVEPEAELARRLAAARPGDVTLAVALGDAPGEAVLHAVPGTGLSTLDAGIAADHAARGFRVERRPVAVETLAAVCRRHAPGPVHVLKIDAEGSEAAVLRGADFAAHRPWVVLVEATRPLSAAPAHAGWEPPLLAAGYGFAWFDGLNRFYLADEHRARLAPHFAAPPNVFDDYVRADDSGWARRIAAAEAAAAELRARAASAEARAGAAEAGVAAAQRHLLERAAAVSGHRSAAEGLAREVAGLRLALGDQAARGEHLAQRALRAESWLDAVRASTSWRLTRPLRAGTRLALRALGRVPAPPAPPVLPDAPPPDAERRGEAPVAPVALRVPPAPADAPRAPRPLRAVHQFHSGSAVGDAITNAMLLTRRVLRGLGYESEIFVEHRDPALAGELRTLGELPDHAGYALIVRHSMGYDAFARVVALPVPKVLLYHNITPPALLAGSPVLQAYARLGREQLAQARPHVAAALADSEYNAIELRALGFDPVRACTLLFDLDVLAANVPVAGATPRTRAADAPFTVLFVGRVAAAKGQLALAEAFARFRAALGRPARLVLVGRIDDGDGHAAALARRVAEPDLAGHVRLTDLVPDAALAGWYAEADLYVSLSGHEGFGVPIVEAAARGVPVLARASGAVPYTLGDPEGLLDDLDPGAVADRMLALARDPAARAALARRQRAAAARFALPAQVPALLEALALAGVAPPRPADARAALAANLRVTVTGHASGSYSLSSVNRGLALALEATLPGRVRLAPVEGHAPARLDGVPPAQSGAPALAARPPFETGPEVVVSNHYPVHVPDPAGDLPLALFYWEESLVPAPVVARLAAGFRGVLAPSRAVARALVDSGLAVPVRVLGQAPDLAPFRAIAAARRRRARPPGAPVTFLHVSSAFPRKGVDALLAAWAAAFRAGDPVRLVVKAFPNPHNDAAARLTALRAADPGLAPVELVDRDLDEAALLALYDAADAMVLPSRGEGYNLPAAEAMAAALPLLVTGTGGHRDFCGPDTARLLGWTPAPARTHLAVPHSLWAEPDRDDLVAALRGTAAALRDPGGAAGRALAARTRRAEHAIAAAADPAALAERLVDTALDLLLAPPRPPARIAWITSWGVRCGVSEYARQLLGAIPVSAAVAATVVLADERTPHALPDGPGQPRIRPAWRWGDGGSVDALARAVAEEDPDVVVVQHQPGLLGFRALAALLGAPALRGRAVCVTLHTVQQLEEAPEAERRAAVAALAGVARVVAHTLADLDRLRRLGLDEVAVLIPQGAPAPRPPAPVRALAPGATGEGAPVIGCYGFFLPGKGLPELVAAASLLRPRWPGLRLRLVDAEYDHPISAAEIAACRRLADELGMADAVEWHTDFLSEAESLALLAGCDVVALPTQASREGSSASLRTALAAGVPVAVTPLPFYDEAGPAVARLPDASPAGIARGLDALLVDRAAREAVRDGGRAWLADHGWAAIGPRMQGMLLALAAQRPAPGTLPPDAAGAGPRSPPA